MLKSNDLKDDHGSLESIDGKKIGDYIVEDQSCSERIIKHALELQLNLSQEGGYKPLGKILVEYNYITKDDLDRCLKRQRIDILTLAPLFKNIPLGSVIKIADVAEHYVLSQNIPIFRERDAGDAFYIIISGRVRVFRTSDDGIEIMLATLGPGEVFGEMALLTGEPRSATVETVVPTCLLTIPKNAFDQVLTENQELNKAFLKILADRLTIGNIHMAKVLDSERAYKRLLSEQITGPELELIGKSKITQQIRTAIKEVAAKGGPVLISGEAGTEKKIVAALIHQEAGQSDSPFLLLDAKNIIPMSPVHNGQQKEILQIEVSQDSALFGHERGIFSFAKTRRLGLLEVGHEGTVVIENVDHLAESVQRKLAEFISSGTFLPLGGQSKIPSTARIIATSTSDLTELVEMGKFNQKLYELLSPQILTIPSLRKRKRDLNLIVDHLIKRQSKISGKSIKHVDTEAYNKIMTYDWPGNMDELDVVVRRAVNVAQSDILMPEDLFIGLAPIEGKIVFNLIKLEKVRKILQSKLYPAIPQIVIGLILGLLILTGLIGSQNPDSNIFVVLFWGIGWPLLVFSWFLVARSWCTLCPMGGLSDFFNRYYSLRLNVPSFLRKYGVYLSAAGFGIIIWLEEISSMPFSPRATSLLLLFIAFFAVTSGLLFHRRAWCRFLCPLGNLTGILSRCSIMELRGNINVCNNECATHGCYVGEGKLAGCPMYEGPFSLQSNHHCILCGNCVKICTKQAPRLNLRLPGHELWTVLKPDHAMAVFVPLLIGTQLFRGLEHSKLFIYIESVLDQHLAATALLLIGSIILAYLFVTAAGILTFTRLRDSSTSKANLMVYVLLPLTFAFELGFQLKPLLERTGMLIPVLGRQIGFAWESLGLSTSPVMVKAIQIMIVLIGVVGSRTILNRLAKQHEQDYSESKKWRLLWPMLTVSLVYIYLFATG